MDPTNINDLMQQVYDYFLTLYHQNSGTPAGNAFLTFMPIGTPIDPDTFRLPNDVAYSRALAVEHFSELTNTIPAQISADIFQPSSKTVDGFYSLLLLGSSPATTDEDALTVFSTFKAQAKQQFDPTLGSLLQAGIRFHPAYATPTDWYDPAVETNWTVYSASTAQSSSTSTQSGAPTPPIRLDPHVRSWRWQVLPEDLTPVLISPKPQVELERIHRVELQEAVLQHPLHQMAIARQVMPMQALSVPLATQVTQAISAVDRTKLLQVAATQIEPTAVSHVNSVNSAAVAAIDSSAFTTITTQRPIAQAIFQEALVNQTSSQSVSSSNLTVSFKYCLVQADRPWLSQSYLATKNWYVSGYKAGDFSIGAAAGNLGVFPAMPIACLVVKDLVITADWTQADFMAAQQSAAFGPFSLMGRSIDQASSTLTCSGLQVIGWICEIMPYLPPVSAPDA